LVVGAIAAGICAPSLAKNPAPSFSRDVVPVLRQRCVACHMTGTEPGKMSLVPAKAYSTLVETKAVQADMPRVSPKAPARSYLLHKLQGTHITADGHGTRMPPNSTPLPPETIETIRLWVEAGAPNN
jgi:mono/diheme cytochrome c family protein